MNHPGIIKFESERLYNNRNYVFSELDDRHFDALNQDGHVCALNGYCLDALEEMPGGSMSTVLKTPAILFTVRGLSLKEIQDRNALAEQLIAEILAEENQK